MLNLKQLPNLNLKVITNTFTLMELFMKVN